MPNKRLPLALVVLATLGALIALGVVLVPVSADEPAGRPATFADASPAAPPGTDVARAPGPQGEQGEPTPEPAAEPEAAEAPAPYACRVPDVEIPRSRGCAWGLGYPQCKWGLPEPGEGGDYTRWRLTTRDHWWGRPGLVTFLLATAAEHRRRFPDHELAIGDLDAPGPRHATHRRGQDVDLYLPGRMLVDNPGGYRYPSNYEGKTDEEVAAMRAHVEELARILASCADGRVRIYYNDPPVERSFLGWYAGRGLSTPFEAPMMEHNDLHRFHFHVTIPEDTEPLPVATEAAERQVEAAPAAPGETRPG